MTFQEAKEKLSEMAGENYCSIDFSWDRNQKFRKAERIELSLYIADVGTTSGSDNYEDEFNELSLMLHHTEATSGPTADFPEVSNG